MNQPIPDQGSSPDIVLDWLHSDGWTMGHMPQGDEWVVTGFRAGRTFRVVAKTLEDAWLLATEEVRKYHSTFNTGRPNANE